MKVLHLIGGFYKNGAFKGANILHDNLIECGIESEILNNDLANKNKNIKNIYFINNSFLKNIKYNFLKIIDKLFNSIFLPNPRSTFTSGLFGFDITKEKKYKEALKYWNSIDKKSYIWPLTLIEKAWAYYYLKDYNRALGLLVTYKSPLLESYFIPEAEVLKALSYYRMCIYQDTDQVIKRFTEIYEPRSRKLKRILEKYRENDIYFFNLAVKSFDKLPKDSFVRKLAISLFKNPRFERMLASYKAALNELKVIRGSKLRNKAVENYIKKSAFFVRRSINDYIKRNFFNFINEMHAYSGELFKINLEIFRSKKNLVKKDVDVDKASRKRGSLKHVKREEDQYFWKFYGGFWADELGGYSFGLKNQCQTVDKEGEV